MGRGPDKVAGRVWITTSRPGEEPTRIEVVLIAAYRNGRIHRIWETTWPSWRNVAASTITETTTDRLAMRNQLRAGAATLLFCDPMLQRFPATRK